MISKLFGLMAFGCTITWLIMAGLVIFADNVSSWGWVFTFLGATVVLSILSRMTAPQTASQKTIANFVDRFGK